MADGKESVDLLVEIAKSANTFDKRLSSATATLNSFNNTLKDVKSAQSDFLQELRATKSAQKEVPLTSGKVTQDDVNVALYDFAMRMKGSGADTQMEDTLKKSLDVIAKSKESTGEYATKSDNKRNEELNKGIVDAIADGYDVIGAQFTDNPYLRRLGQMQNELADRQKQSRKSVIGGKLEELGKWGGENPITRMLGGIGGMMGTAKNVGATVGNAGSFLFGGGIGARRADIGIEKARRENVRASTLINAKQGRVASIADILAHNNVSADERKSYEAELAKIKKENEITIQGIKARSNTISKNIVTSMDYKTKRLDPKGYGSYSKSDKSYLNANLEKNVLNSLVGKLSSGGNTNTKTFGGAITATNPFYGNSNKSQTIGSVVSDKNRSQRIGGVVSDRNRYYDRTPNMTNSVVSATGDVVSRGSAKQRSPQKNMVSDATSWIYPHSIGNPKTITDYVAGIYTTINDPSFRNSGAPSVVSGDGGSSLFSSLLPSLVGGIGTTIMTSIGTSMLGKTTGKVLGKVGKVGGFAGKAVRGAGSLLGKAGKGFGGIAAKLGGKFIGKEALSVGLKKLPVIGALAGLGFGGYRALQGDYTGAGMEVASGAASLLPGIGTGASFGIDAAIAARDMYRDNNVKPDTMKLEAPNMQNNVTPDKMMKMQAKANAEAMLDAQDSHYGRKISDRETSAAARKTGEEFVK